jgi:heat shock protein HtpX
MNTVKTGLLMAALACLLVILGQVIGGTRGAIVMFVIAGAMNFFAYFYSHKLVLKMYRAQPVERGDAPELYGIVERLVERAGMPMPKVYIIPNQAPNAFATGRNPSHAAVTATEGLLRSLNRDEVEAVLAHELAHVQHRDTLIQTVVATLAGAITLLAMIGRWGMLFGLGDDDDNPLGLIVGLLMLILAPIAALLIQLWISRTREFGADEGGARLCGQPMALARALQRLEAGARRAPMQANAATSHLFIVNPLSGRQVAKLFSTHPSTEDRVARLRDLAARGVGT